MSLAFSFDNNRIEEINDSTHKIIDNIIRLSEYKDCVEFVKYVNNEKIFTIMLAFLELAYEAEINPEKRKIVLELDVFKAVIPLVENKVEAVKNFKNKVMKKKMLRMDNEQLEIFELLKLRYKQIQNNAFPQITAILENQKDEGSSEFDLDCISLLDTSYLLIGVTYLIYQRYDADFLNPTVKKLIKKYFVMSKKYDLELEPNSFEFLNEVSSIGLKKALNVLAS